ncbi:MAG TPA: GxxExxY protein [Bacteroidia bacterium]|jgi:GxxExxY protein|nr:GxxExxY protein [Bacteroidia bacterium]
MNEIENESQWMVAEDQPKYSNDFLSNPDLLYKLIGICMEVHRELGRGLSEVLYKDAIEQEFKWKGITYEREKKFTVDYKGITLPHYYFADFVVGNEIILELKAQQNVIENHYGQVINYLAISKCPLGLLVNFAERSLQYKRIILTP